MQKIDKSESENPEHFQIFVGGCSLDTTPDLFYSYFSKYGEVVDHRLVYDKLNGNFRGFGFVTFLNGKIGNSVLGS
jgi:RNA recognition motif-containing protein